MGDFYFVKEDATQPETCVTGLTARFHQRA